MRAVKANLLRLGPGQRSLRLGTRSHGSQSAAGKGKMAFWIGMAVFMGLIISLAILGGAIVGKKRRRGK